MKATSPESTRCSCSRRSWPRWSLSGTLATALTLLCGASFEGVAVAQAPLPDDPSAPVVLPPGHPPIDDRPSTADMAREDDEGDDDEESGADGEPPIDAPAQASAGANPQLPPGHPPVTGHSSADPLPRTAENSATEDTTLPAGTVAVELRDGFDQPVPKVRITLNVLVQTIAKSDDRRQLAATTDDSGEARFHGLPVGATASYRATVSWPTPDGDPATYSAPPFELDLAKGERVRIHAYPATHDISDTLVGMQGMVYVELHDEVLQVYELFRIFNMGRKSWVPNDVLLDLPPQAKAFHSESSMTDARFEAERSSSSVRLRGTYPPGRQEVEMRYQVPYTPGRRLDLSLPMPPHMASANVIAEGSKDTQLSVAGFPQAKPDRNQTGQRVLVASRQLRAGEQPLSRLDIALENLPGPGSEPLWAAGFAAAALLAGLYFALSPTAAPGHKLAEQRGEQAREQLVAELRALEKARAAGTVGPKTYARARQELVDALARLLAPKATA